MRSSCDAWRCDASPPSLLQSPSHAWAGGPASTRFLLCARTSAALCRSRSADVASAASLSPPHQLKRIAQADSPSGAPSTYDPVAGRHEIGHDSRSEAGVFDGRDVVLG